MQYKVITWYPPRPFLYQLKLLPIQSLIPKVVSIQMDFTCQSSIERLGYHNSLASTRIKVHKFESWASACAGVAASFCLKLSWQHINDENANPGPLTRNRKTMNVSRTKPMSHGTMLVYFPNSFHQTIHCHVPRGQLPLHPTFLNRNWPLALQRAGVGSRK